MKRKYQYLLILKRRLKYYYDEGEESLSNMGVNM